MKTKIDAEWIARVIAESDDNVQSDFFNELGRILPLICKHDIGYETQVAYFCDKLDSYGKLFIREIYAFIGQKESRLRENKKNENEKVKIEVEADR